MNATMFFMLSGVALGLLIILSLLVRKDANIRANRILAGSLACSMCYLIGLLLVQGGYGDNSRLPTILALTYILGVPLMFGYVRLLTDPGYRLRMTDALHLAPWIILTGVVLARGTSVDTASLQAARGGWPPSSTSLLAVAMYLTSATYMVWALSVLNVHQHNMNEVFSYRERHSLVWLKILIRVYLVLSIVGLTIAVIRWIPGVELWPRSIYSTSMIIGIYYLIAFIGISQPAIPQTDLIRTPAQPTEPENREQQIDTLSAPQPRAPRYETSALTTEALREIGVRLEQVMLEEQPYLNAQLRIADLAKTMDLPPHHLSQAINQMAGKNFFEFINHYRVEEAKALLAEGAGSATSVAFDAGFNSQSSFYRQFKKDTGMTPRQFQRQSNA